MYIVTRVAFAAIVFQHFRNLSVPGGGLGGGHAYESKEVEH